MFTDLADRDAFVYHYTSAGKAIDLILPKRRLLLGSYARTNDPKETKEWTFALGGLRANERYIDLAKVSADVSSAIKRRAHVFCTSTDAPPGPEHIGPEIHSRGFARPRMWDQYGDRHKGLCLIFFRPHLDLLIEAQHRSAFRKSKQILYQNRPISPDLSPHAREPYLINMAHLRQVGIDRYARDHIVTHWEHLFFEKAEDWRDEREFRWLVANDSDAPVFVDYEGSLPAIVFGQDCPDVQVRAAVRLAKGHGASYEQLLWKNAAPWLSFRMDWSGM